MRIVNVFLLTAVLIGCGSDAGKSPNLDEVAYFDLKGYFEQEKEQIKTRSSFSKKVTVNGEVEEKLTETIDFENDLRIFQKSDINRPAWSDKYSIDSLLNIRNELIGLTYKSLDSKLRTELVEIKYDNGRVDKILIENRTESSIAKTKQVLTYIPRKGYLIESIQNMATMDSSVFKVEVSFE